MKFSFLIALIVAGAALAFTGCTPSRALYVYEPPPQQAPLNSAKHEMHVVGSYNGNGKGPFNQGLASFTLADRWAVMGTYMAVNVPQPYAPDDPDVKGNYFEGAISYFIPLGKHFTFEVPAGCGFETLTNTYFENDYAVIHIVKPFMQPQIGFRSAPFDCIFSTQISMLQFRNFEDHLAIASYGDELMKTNPALFDLEPAVTLRLGWKYVKFQMQMVFSLADAYGYVPLSYGNINIGLQIAIPTLDKNKTVK